MLPIELSDFEIQLLSTVSRDWYRPKERVPLVALGQMGMIEWGRDAENKVTCRLTAAGTDQLTISHRPEGET